ncbi:MAG: BLUF domain-containing protein [Planctomycetota bacterium]
MPMTDAMQDDLIQIVYVSTASRRPTPELLDSIRAAARERNPSLGITGVLLYGSGLYVQLLEGPPEEVHDLLASIEGDDRHRNVRILVSQLSEKRSAQAWSMGVLDLDAIEDEAESLEGIVRDLVDIFDDIEWDNNAGPAIEDLVMAFQRYGGPAANEHASAA